MLKYIPMKLWFSLKANIINHCDSPQTHSSNASVHTDILDVVFWGNYFFNEMRNSAILSNPKIISGLMSLIVAWGITSTSAS